MPSRLGVVYLPNNYNNFFGETGTETGPTPPSPTPDPSGGEDSGEALEHEEETDH